jgi:CRP/FNR family cyclic AMP-dependent transcriptional regulator
MTLRPLPDRIAAVRATAFFGHLAEDDVVQIANRLTERSFDKGVAVFRAGDPSDALFLLVRGRIAIRDGLSTLVTLEPPECFGELGVLAEEPRSADAVCEASCELLRLASTDLQALLRDRPAIQRQVMRGLVRRVKEAGRRARQ